MKKKLILCCAAILVFMLTREIIESPSRLNPQVEAIVANQALLAMQVMEDHHFTTKRVPKADLPLGCLKSAEAAVGRVLAVSVVAGQILKESNFVWRGTGAELAAKIPEGMRVFTIHLSKAVTDRIILYPRCIVDVMFTSKPSDGEKGQAVTITILQGIQVLSVWGDSVVSTPTPGQSNTTRTTSRARGLTVSLQVDPYQAEALQMASDNSTLSLAVCNPSDTSNDDMDWVRWDRFRPRFLPNPPSWSRDLLPNPPSWSRDPLPNPPYRTPKSHIREVIVIRGRKTTAEEVSASKERGAGDNTDE